MTVYEYGFKKKHYMNEWTYRGKSESDADVQELRVSGRFKVHTDMLTKTKLSYKNRGRLPADKIPLQL